MPVLHVCEALASAHPTEGIRASEILAVMTVHMLFLHTVYAWIASLEDHDDVPSSDHLVAAMECPIAEKPRAQALDHMAA
eukprot:CAMPEP_0183373646 /NCGR_PEP_ID=MMETSP0164_2-20130417/112050_1 /TAXON_ID=221442 /ORGANISM="Coccolithus pelagicus ssp braarudi, Strain PLY182g" /LENGTH=79 /DNA_ID=CAMNT_0025550563 /DNA_START=635 /DNA_END=870 /DNA_ORIENTATION=+